MEGLSSNIVTCSFILVLLHVATAFGTEQKTGGQSCGDKEVFLTSNSTLAPLNLIEVSGVTSGYPATYLYNVGYFRDDFFETWCTADFKSPTHFAQMELLSPVLITQIQTSGRSTLSNTFFVTNFTLEYSPHNDPTNLSYYLTDTGDIQYFTTSHINTLIQFKQPLLAKHLRVRPKAWLHSDRTLSFEYICLGIGLYGCLATEASDQDDPVQSTVTTLNIGQNSETTAEAAIENSNRTAAESMTVVVKDNQAVAIVLPIALLTIIINTAIVGVGVFFCVFLNRQNKEKIEENHPHSNVNLEMSTKSLGQSQTSLVDDPVNSERLNMPRTSVDVIKKVDNPIYGSNFSPDMTYSNATADEHIYTSASETGYEPVEPTLHTKMTDEEDLLDNQAYNGVDINPENPHNHVDNYDLEMKGNASYGSVCSTPIDPGVHFKMFGDDELVDNQAYAEVDTKNEIAEHHIHNFDPQLKENACYGSGPSTTIPDEGVHTYLTDNYEPVEPNDYDHY